MDLLEMCIHRLVDTLKPAICKSLLRIIIRCNSYILNVLSYINYLVYSHVWNLI